MKTKTKTTHNYNTTNNNETNKKVHKKIINQHFYDRSLARRGDFLVFFHEAKKQNAFKKPLCKHLQGHPEEYSDELIKLILIYREIYHQPLRQAIRFTTTILWSQDIIIRMPAISTVSRRAAKLNIKLLPPEYYLYQGEPMLLAVDSSGFKTHGEGEWFRRKYGIQKHREWQESHIGVDVPTRLIPAVLNTGNNIHDNTMLLPLLTETERNTRLTGIIRPLEGILGDGAYDCNDNYLLARKLHTKFIAPPPTNAVCHYIVHGKQITEDPDWHDRNEVVKEIKYRTSLEEWKQNSGYHQRSLVENAFYRLKNTFGDKMRNRTEANRNTEQRLKVMILNRFTMYGLPKYG